MLLSLELSCSWLRTAASRSWRSSNSSSIEAGLEGRSAAAWLLEVEGWLPGRLDFETGRFGFETGTFELKTGRFELETGRFE